METIKKAFKKTSKQINAIDLMSRYVEVLLEGGSRSGKTFIACYAIIARALKYNNSHHLIVRKHFNHIKQSIWYQTIPNVLRIAFSGYKIKENKSDWFIEFQNGSQIWIAGTDDKERIEKILGSEWDTIYMNEASQMAYNTYEMLKTRLNPQKGIKPLFLIDYNPPSKKHWGFKIFRLKVHPENNLPLSTPDRYAFLKMNPTDNKENLSDGYIDTLESMSEKNKKRFLDGEYSDDSEGALWRREWITKFRIDKAPLNLIRIVVALDPNVTDDKKADENTDEAGIITVAHYKIGLDDHYCVLSDDSTPGLSWGETCVQVYHKYNADKVIGEVNQGGDLIEMNIRNYDKQISYDSVRATRGKEVRAEPVADLYRRGFVHHVGEFPELEDELCSWVPGVSRSPNRLDAVVWGISYLAGLGEAYAKIRKW